MQDTFLRYGFSLSEGEIAQFSRYLDIFQEYNAHTNLSAIRDAAGIIEKHFIDSLMSISALQDLLPGAVSDDHLLTEGHETPHLRVLDIGSGGGFPGIPLKIAYPELDVTLLDSVGKKVKAMEHFISSLGLIGIRALQDRAEVLGKHPDHRGHYDIVVSRATAYVTDILRWAEPFLASTGMIILYKMPSIEERRDMIHTCKKLKLHLIGEIEYMLGEKERVIYVLRKV